MAPSIRWRIAVPYVALIIVMMTGLSAYLSFFTDRNHRADLRAQLHAEAVLLGDAFKPLLTPSTPNEQIAALTQEYGRLLSARVTVIAPDGTVRGDSHADWQQMENHLERPEIRDALAHGEGENSRYSTTSNQRLMYLAVAVYEDQILVGFVRVGLPLQQIESNTLHLMRTLLLALLLATLLSLLLAILIAQRTTRPLLRLTRATQRMANGDFSARILPTSRDEIGALTHDFNRMAEQLQQQVTALSGERDRLRAILDHMADGVLITDKEGRVRLLNPAAKEILNLRDLTLGLSFAQTVRDHQLIELWRHCHEQREEQLVTLEVNFFPRFLRVVITPLQTSDLDGCLVILQDLTRLHRLETVRHDLISNISHELRTPLAALKSLTDTLRGGTLSNPAETHRFLDRIESEIDALAQMVEELMELARIESGRVPLKLHATSVTAFIKPAVERLLPQAERTGLTIATDLPSDLPPVLVDPDRLIQVMTNLIHNAIKFTPKGRITITARRAESEVQISVADTGIGIPPEALERIFERFYKADRSRSGGGTGLGLAIARHLVQAHQGRIWAESIEGQGTTVTITLPVADKE